MVKPREREIIAVGICEDEESPENAQQMFQEFMGQVAEFLDGAPETTLSEVVRSFIK